MKSLAAMDSSLSRDAVGRKLTSEMLASQKNGQPIHDWPIIRDSVADDWEQGYRTVGQFMSRDLFTVGPDDLIDLAASVMDWRHIRHVPVEDQDGRLIGLITHRGVLRMMSRSGNADDKPTTVREVMVENPLTVTPSTSSLEAIEIMRSNRVGCLPVVEGDQLVGIVTSYDFLEATAKLFQQHLKAKAAGAAGAAAHRGGVSRSLVRSAIADRRRLLLGLHDGPGGGPCADVAARRRGAAALRACEENGVTRWSGWRATWSRRWPPTTRRCNRWCRVRWAKPPLIGRAAGAHPYLVNTARGGPGIPLAVPCEAESRFRCSALDESVAASFAPA